MIPGSANPLLMAAAQDTGYNVSRSLRFNAPDSAYLSRTPGSAGNRKTWTWSGWAKFPTQTSNNNEGGLFVGYNSNTNRTQLFITGNMTLRFLAGGSGGDLSTAAVFRDPSAWYHIVATLDTTAATTFRLYVNGVEQTLSGTYPGANSEPFVNATNVHYLGAMNFSGVVSFFNGYLANVEFVDGSALTPSSFGETNATTGQWVPKAFSGGSYGTNGFKLTFSDNSNVTSATLGKDSSGNNNDWTPFNVQVANGGPTSVASASGALPIYNTTDTYGTTKGSGTRTDSNSSSIVLAVPMDGTNGGTSFSDIHNTIKGSGSAKTLTRFGDTQTSTAQSKFYGSSGYFDGTGDYLTVAASSDFSFGSGNFTIECWLYATNTSNCDIFGYYNGDGTGFAFIVGNPYGAAQTAGTISIFDDKAGGDFLNAPGGTVQPNRWVHLAVVRNGSDLRIYRDGISVASKTTSATAIGEGSQALGIGRMTGSLSRNVNGYISDFRVYKGVAKYTGNFNPPTNPQQAALIGAGNDSLVDTPTSYGTDTGVGAEVRGNYCTWNPLDRGSPTPSNGNLDVTGTSTHQMIRGTVGITSGKWYWEILINSIGTEIMIGIAKQNAPLNFYVGRSASGWAYWSANGQKVNNDSNQSYGATYTTNDVIGVAFDADNGTLTFYKNNASQGTAYTGLTSGPYLPAISQYAASGSNSTSVNFGQRPFAYTAPSGFKALCDTSLPTPTIVRPSTVFQATLWSGNSTNNRSISGLDFSPDFVWIKNRSSSAGWNVLFDVVRGAGNQLATNQTDAELATGSNLAGKVGSFDSSGFTLVAGSGSSPYKSVNETDSAYVGWTWDAGSSTVTNTQGSITSSVRANASAGFSIVTYTGNGVNNATVGHGLGVAPQFLIGMDRTGGNWQVWGANMNSGSFDCVMNLNTTGALATGITTRFRAASSTTFTIGTDGDINTNGSAYVVYAWAPVANFSAIGSYLGTGSADGPFQWCGFRPRWLLVKATGAINENWVIIDTLRSDSNLADEILWANLSSSEFGNYGSGFDFTANGFKVRGTWTGNNSASSSYVWAAFAESPFQYARAR